MADGTTAAPAPSTEEERDTFPAPVEMVPLLFTKKYDSYRSQAGPQFNAGELASLPKDEAERLIQNGAAVRQGETSDHSSDEKASTHPNKMQGAARTK